MVAAFPFIGCKKNPKPVNPNDGVRCCFSVPYEGLNGQTINQSQCKTDLVCPKPDDKDTDDVCKPLACKTRDGAGTDQSPPPHPDPGDAGGADSSGT